jgi:hypothetical protein
VGFGLFPFSFAENIMIIDAHATDTVPSHEVRRRAQQALTNAGEPMSEVTYDALRKRLAEAEEELSIWRSVFPDIAPERVLPDRSLQHKDIADLKAALHDVACHIWRGDWHRLRSETRAILDTMERKS